MTDKMRAEFEEWMRSEGQKHVMADCVCIDGGYVFPETKILFVCWQASRAALVVELPSTYYDQFGDLALDYNATIEGFDKAGIRYE